MKKTIIAFALVGCAHMTGDVSSGEDKRDPAGAMDSLRDPDHTVRARAAVALGRIAAPQSIPRLRQALEDRDTRVRAAVAFALGIAEDTESERALVSQLSQATSEPEREAIIVALGRVGGELAAEVLARIGDARSLTAIGVIGYRKGHIPPNSATRVVEKLTAEDAGVRWASAYALSRLPNTFEQSIEALTTACSDPDAEVRAMAVRALGVHGPDQVDVLAKALADTDWHVRVQAARALGETARGSIKLASMLDESMGFHPLIAALEALRPEASRPEVSEAAAKFAEHAHQNIRCAAGVLVDLPLETVRATRGCGPDEARVTKDSAALKKLWDEGDAKIKIAVAEQLGKMVRERQGGSKLLAEIAEVAKDPGALAAISDAVRAAAEAGWRNQAVALVLEKRLSKAIPLETRISIIGALGALAESATADSLKKSLTHHNPAVRDAARKALDALNVEVPSSIVVDTPPPSEGNVGEARTKKLRAKIETDRGPIVIELYGEDSPRTVASFVHLARTNFYDGLTFHRVVPDFVIQGGDPRGDGYGGASYTLRCEYNQHRYGAGAVGMALAGKDTGSSQFFITHSKQPHLDGRYTLFGQVVDGMDVVEAIQPGDVIKDVRIEAAK